jgi:hypothetical protein
MKPLFLVALTLAPGLAGAETVTQWTPEQIEAVASLGNDGVFAFSFENTQFDQWRYYRRR